MSDKYKIKIHSHNPEVAEKLINGTGLFHMLHDTINGLGKQLNENRFMPADSPFFALTKSDFDIDDPIVSKFFDNGGLDNAVKVIKLQLPNTNRFTNFKLCDTYFNILRHIFW
jgi:hypothetical protein